MSCSESHVFTRSTVQCSENHTPLCPAKNEVRSDWLWATDREKDIITISHGAFDVLNILRWQGRIFPCDTDPGVRQSVHYMLSGTNGNPGQYPRLKIQECGGDVGQTTLNYLRAYGGNNLGAVDVDLADTLENTYMIAGMVLAVLLAYKCHTRVLFTFRNGRDRFNGIDKRLAWLKAHLPTGVKLVSHTAYNSLRIGKKAEREIGSAMCIVELTT